VVNAVGCVGIGFAGALFFGPRLVREEYRIAIMIGLLGGFTTFSSFAWESFRLIDEREFGVALGYVVLSNVLGLVAVWFSYRIGVRLVGV
jgi:CrcB protein